MTTFREVLIEEEYQNHKQDVQFLLNKDYVYRTNQGYEIDVLKLVDTLNKKQRTDLFKYLTLKQYDTR